MDPKVASQYPITLARSDRACARGMMSPCVVANEAPEVIIRRAALTRQFFLIYEFLMFQRCGQSPDESDAVDYRFKIFIRPFLEISKIYLWSISRIGRAKCYLSRAVSRLPLQHHPAEIVKVFCELPGVVGEITFEVREQGHTKEIWSFVSNR